MPKMRNAFRLTAALSIGVALASFALAQQPPRPRTDAELIANALSAAPEAVARGAAVMVMDERGGMKMLKSGTNNFTCMPDNPGTPGDDPMCVDPNGMEWVMAWVGKKTPPAGKVGFGYMLKGGSDASNNDPFATAPAPGQRWVDTGPHVMVFNAGAMTASYPRTAADTKIPYVMWPGTPYEHLMIPVR